MMTSTMFERKSSSSFVTNGTSSSSRLAGTRQEEQKEPTAMFTSRIRLNEWTFSLSLLALSLSIVLGKLCVNYGNSLLPPTRNRYSLPSTFTQMYNRISGVPDLTKFDVKRLSLDSERFVNASNQYAGAAASALAAFYGQYCWFFQAIMCGLLITSFTWFIIYKDSSVPGINPPSPFSPSKYRIHGSSGRSRIQINYLLGMLNGILFFIYMCL